MHHATERARPATALTGMKESRLAELGIIGQAVMGRNLALNACEKGIPVAVYDREASLIQAASDEAEGALPLIPATSLEEFLSLLERPRKILFMIKAGKPVENLLEEILPHLAPGDIVIDGGNSHYQDTARRCTALKNRGIRFIGAGISGGEEGARSGPSIMPGGDESAWPLVAPILQALAAKSPRGTSCCSWIGRGGAGHFVKMIHNGIEYAEMQAIAEAYHLMKDLLGMSNQAMHEAVSLWTRGPLKSYLLEITASILIHPDSDGSPLLEKILDQAGQKGTGKWSVLEGLDRNVPLPSVGAAVCARQLSSLRSERCQAADIFGRISATSSPASPGSLAKSEPASLLRDLEKALLANRVVTYAQGFEVIRVAAQQEQWQIDLAELARIWTRGCIIRTPLLEDIARACHADPSQTNLLLTPPLAEILRDASGGWRRLVAAGISAEVPLPALASGLTFFDGYKSRTLPANLIQAMRDYFGAHLYQRKNDEPGKYHHTNWTGAGGAVSSSLYNA
ncbi:6-phosphogluconate dehydrogenase [Alkalispirochaeta americana]|uniref:6-phosphogluconate dehydrogenase, decarboxylating n=1 Tax=Alkalispirochaeta americana TaxID=159291 RepID=A0A1N6UWP9_9SPIO|nr:decarboxylating NADP(+)-dependent phosphogluconate dehydrogenase [Alkalispirochaeta americana]SIQ69676.1 6-phosphogluconate dehydrogenase [Alkalispirochaeta americana]